MTRDHLLGFPALALADNTSSRSPKYGLGVPRRVYAEMHARACRESAARDVFSAFEEKDHTPEHMRPPAAPAADGWIERGRWLRPVDGLVSLHIGWRYEVR